jgi:hypothetical protein
MGRAGLDFEHGGVLVGERGRRTDRGRGGIGARARVPVAAAVRVVAAVCVASAGPVRVAVAVRVAGAGAVAVAARVIQRRGARRGALVVVAGCLGPRSVRGGGELGIVLL